MTYVYLTLAKICHTVPFLRKPFWRYVYEAMAARFTLPEWTFMNYGYLPDPETPSLDLDDADENDRNLIALYNHVANAGDLGQKNVLEVGSGRGGGASFVARYLKPEKMTGIDISESAVAFCKATHLTEALDFQQGDAEAIPFAEAEFDAVLNVESSHCYGSQDAFISEVFRVLKPGGSFLYADFRPTGEVDAIAERIARTGFIIHEKEDITQNVLSALEADSATKEKLIHEIADSSLQQTLRIFAATSGTKLYKEFQAGALYYFRFHAVKP
jgi:ubiquinone/menaquinone biosynthesis C-methylase UbiE